MRNGSGGKVAQQFKIQGLSEVMEALRRLPDELQEAALKNASAAGARIIRDEAKRLVPVRTGTLRDSIVVARRFKQSRNYKVRRGAVVVGIKGVGRFYAHLVEFGWSKHGARSFMRAALDAKAGEAIKASSEKLGKEVLRAAKKLGSTSYTLKLMKRLKRLR